MQHLIVDRGRPDVRGEGRVSFRRMIDRLPLGRRSARALGIAALALGVLGLSACGTSPVAHVNGEVITQAEVQRDMRDLMSFMTMARGANWADDPRAQTELLYLRAQVLANVVDTRLIRQQATREGIVVSERAVDERAAEIIEIAGGRDEFLARMRERGLTSLAFRQYIEDELLRERLAERHVVVSAEPVEMRHVRHVLVESEAAAQAARERLAKGESWEVVAAEVSQDPGTRTNGGDLGFLAPGGTVPAFDEAAFSLPVNALSQPVETQFGFHILQVTEAKTQPPTPEQLQRREEQAFADYLAGLRQQAEIDYHGLDTGALQVPGTP